MKNIGGRGGPLSPTAHRPLPTLPTLRLVRAAIGGLETGRFGQGKVSEIERCGNGSGRELESNAVISPCSKQEAIAQERVASQVAELQMICGTSRL